MLTHMHEVVEHLEGFSTLKKAFKTKFGRVHRIDLAPDYKLCSKACEEEQANQVSGDLVVWPLVPLVRLPGGNACEKAKDSNLSMRYSPMVDQAALQTIR